LTVWSAFPQRCHNLTNGELDILRKSLEWTWDSELGTRVRNIVEGIPVGAIPTVKELKKFEKSLAVTPAVPVFNDAVPPIPIGAAVQDIRLLLDQQTTVLKKLSTGKVALYNACENRAKKDLVMIHPDGTGDPFTFVKISAHRLCCKDVRFTDDGAVVLAVIRSPGECFFATCKQPQFRHNAEDDPRLFKLLGDLDSEFVRISRESDYEFILCWDMKMLCLALGVKGGNALWCLPTRLHFTAGQAALLVGQEDILSFIRKTWPRKTREDCMRLYANGVRMIEELKKERGLGPDDELPAEELRHIYQHPDVQGHYAPPRMPETGVISFAELLHAKIQSYIGLFIATLVQIWANKHAHEIYISLQVAFTSAKYYGIAAYLNLRWVKPSEDENRDTAQHIADKLCGEEMDANLNGIMSDIAASVASAGAANLHFVGGDCKPVADILLTVLRDMREKFPDLATFLPPIFVLWEELEELVSLHFTMSFGPPGATLMEQDRNFHELIEKAATIAHSIIAISISFIGGCHLLKPSFLVLLIQALDDQIYLWEKYGIPLAHLMGQAGERIIHSLKDTAKYHTFLGRQDDVSLVNSGNAERIYAKSLTLQSCMPLRGAATDIADTDEAQWMPHTAIATGNCRVCRAPGVGTICHLCRLHCEPLKAAIDAYRNPKPCSSQPAAAAAEEFLHDLSRAVAANKAAIEPQPAFPTGPSLHPVDPAAEANEFLHELQPAVELLRAHDCDMAAEGPAEVKRRTKERQNAQKFVLSVARSVTRTQGIASVDSISARGEFHRRGKQGQRACPSNSIPAALLGSHIPHKRPAEPAANPSGNKRRRRIPQEATKKR